MEAKAMTTTHNPSEPHRALQPKNLSRSSIQSVAYHNWLKAKLDSDFLMVQPLVVMVGEGGVCTAGCLQSKHIKKCQTSLPFSVSSLLACPLLCWTYNIFITVLIITMSSHYLNFFEELLHLDTVFRGVG